MWALEERNSESYKDTEIRTLLYSEVRNSIISLLNYFHSAQCFINCRKTVFSSKVFSDADLFLKVPSAVKGSLQLLTRDNDKYPGESLSKQRILFSTQDLRFSRR
jgi:hypothetical protein